MKSFLYWTPRVLTILFTAFISIFSFDVFDAGYTPRETAVALFMHLIPTFLLIILLIIAWQWERAGGLLFIGLALLFLVWFGGVSLFTGININGVDNVNWFGGVILPGIVALVGFLFLADQSYRSKHPVKF